MKMGKKKLKFKILIVCLMTIMTFGFVSQKTFAKSNIDFSADNDIFDLKFSNVIFSSLNVQVNETNLIAFSFYNDNDSQVFDVYFNIYQQGNPTINVDDEYNFEITKLTNFNFIDELILLVDDINDVDTDYVSVIENGYFMIYEFESELYDIMIDSDYFNVDFIVYEPTILDRFFNVFLNVGTYLMLLINGLIVVFYANNQLTFLGILALCGLAIAIILLILKIIQNFLHFRG